MTITCLWAAGAASVPICACVGRDTTHSTSKAAAILVIAGSGHHIRTSSYPDRVNVSVRLAFWRHHRAHRISDPMHDPCGNSLFTHGRYSWAVETMGQQELVFRWDGRNSFRFL